MKMPRNIAEFLIRVAIAENPGSVSDPVLSSEEDRRAWMAVWPGWKLEQNALERALQQDQGRLTNQQRARLIDRIRRLDRLTYAGPRAKTPLNVDEALFSEAVWDTADPERPTETLTEPGDSTSRADPARRSTGR